MIEFSLPEGECFRLFSKKEFDVFKKEVESALENLARKFNVSIKAGKIKYSSDNFCLELCVSKKEVDGKPFEQAEFEKYCNYYGFAPEDYRKEFIYGGRKFMLVGFNTSARKLPVIAIAEDGVHYKFGTDIKARLTL